MKKSDDLYDLSPEQLEILNGGKYLPGNYKKEANDFLAGNGRCFVRASGTEQLVRILAEAPTDELCRQADDIVLKAVEKYRAE